jgi:hypothetical protein
LKADGALTLPPDAQLQEIWTWVVSALADLRDIDSQPQVMALYRRDLIDESIIGGLDDYLAEFEPDARPPLAASREYDILVRYEGLHEQAAWEAEAKQRARAVQPVSPLSALQTADYHQPSVLQPLVRTQPKIGRNDPCPCGSGRKYKHCCGKRRRS